MLRLDLAGTIQACNAAFTSMLGTTDTAVIGEPFSALVAEEERDGIVRALADVVLGTTTGYQGEHVLLDSDGGHLRANCSIVVLLDSTAQPAHLIGVFEDMTIRHLLEIELTNAQKLEAVGRLAAGIAHEINTPTQFVGDNLFFMQQATQDLVGVVSRVIEVAERLGQADPRTAELISEARGSVNVEWLASEISASLDQARDGVSRVSTIVRAMKAFGHPDGDEMSRADLNAALENTIIVSRNEWKYVATIDTELGEVPLVPCHLHDLNQVFLNLIVNAAHAIEDRNGPDGELGRITIRTNADDDTVTVSVSDTGTGVPEAIRDRILDPFFTTKEVGRGTGQGLAIARSIVVDGHGGTLSFESEVGTGTTFFIRLPVQPRGRRP
jgi:PAS domain S-box-containing protein